MKYFSHFPYGGADHEYESGSNFSIGIDVRLNHLDRLKPVFGISFFKTSGKISQHFQSHNYTTKYNFSVENSDLILNYGISEIKIFKNLTFTPGIWLSRYVKFELDGEVYRFSGGTDSAGNYIYSQGTYKIDRSDYTITEISIGPYVELQYDIFVTEKISIAPKLSYWLNLNYEFEFGEIPVRSFILNAAIGFRYHFKSS